VHKVGKKEQAPAYENARESYEGYDLQLDADEVRSFLLKIKPPRDSFCLIAVTMHDLYVIKNGEAWNFVFGQVSSSTEASYPQPQPQPKPQPLDYPPPIQASAMNGVGVFSFARYGPSVEDEWFNSTSMGGDFSAALVSSDYQVLLRRCCRVLTHEGGHVIGLKHCIHFECLMNGSNSMEVLSQPCV